MCGFPSFHLESATRKHFIPQKFCPKALGRMGHTDGESPSDDEKRLDYEKKLSDENGQFENSIDAELPPDPDAHLTEAERAKIVGMA